MCLLIYFPFPIIQVVLEWHYICSHFLFPLPLGSQCVYLFISLFLDFLLFWMDPIYPDIFYFLSYWNHSLSTYLFSLTFNSCCSGWTLYIQTFSISSATQITVCLLIYFPFPLLPAILVEYYMFSHFLFLLLLGSHCIYLFISPYLDFLQFWLDTLYPVIFYFLCYSDHSVSTCLFSISFTSCYSAWILYVQSFSFFSATRIRVGLLIYFPFPLFPAVLDGYYISTHFLFPVLLGSQCVYLFTFPFFNFLLFRMVTICSVIFYFLSHSDHSVST